MARTGTRDAADLLSAMCGMKIAILNPVRTGASGGAVKHLTELLPRLLRSGSVDYIEFITPESALCGAEETGATITTVPADDYRHGFRAMGAAVQRKAFDVALCLATRQVSAVGLPLVTMVQNIEPIQERRYSAPPVWRLRLWALRREQARACAEATRVLAVSGHTKAELCRRFGLSPERVDVVYHGVDLGRSARMQKPSVPLPERFVFAAGSIVPYRGFEDIIKALAKLRRAAGNAPTLVLAGSVPPHARSYARCLRRLVVAVGMSEKVVWAGQLSPAEMRWCYRNAVLFVQSSRAEACPNIQLEALASGGLCVSCDNPPMPEITQNAALYYPVGNEEALAERMCELQRAGAEVQTRLRELARRRAAEFTWDGTAAGTLEVMRKAIRDYTTRASERGRPR